MSQDVFTLFGGMTTENLMETISKSMDDFLYVFDIQNNKIEISQSAVDRFMIYNEYGRWDGSDLTDGIHSTAGRNRIEGKKSYLPVFTSQYLCLFRFSCTHTRYVFSVHRRRHEPFFGNG